MTDEFEELCFRRKNIRVHRGKNLGGLIVIESKLQRVRE